MFIDALVFFLIVVAAFAFGYHTGYDRARDKAAFDRAREAHDRAREAIGWLPESRMRDK
jgi:hypothetical protein